VKFQDAAALHLQRRRVPRDLPNFQLNTFNGSVFPVQNIAGRSDNLPRHAGFGSSAARPAPARPTRHGVTSGIEVAEIAFRPSAL
jgi:hypothetical protein